MKKLRIYLALITVSIASLGTMSLNHSTKSANPGDLIWIDENGQQYGPLTPEEMQSLCGGSQVHCSYGYFFDQTTGEPFGDPVQETLMDLQ